MHSSLTPARPFGALLVAVSLLPACASRRSEPIAEPPVRYRDIPAQTYRETSPEPPRAYRDADRDDTLRGAGIGAAAGAAGALLLGQRAADDILVGATVGAAVGAGVGAYLDAQEQRLARIPGTSVERADRDTLLVRFDSDLLFPVNSDRPTAQSLAMLAEVGDLLVRYDRTAVVVQGHTDSTGPKEYNQELSERRATAVQNLLIDRGVDPSRLVAIGHGELYPIAGNGFEDGRRRNRRVTILLKAKGA
jgi:outer membrane protein OmpA-like peptidoglycan-associated protein